MSAIHRGMMLASRLQFLESLGTRCRFKQPVGKFGGIPVDHAHAQLPCSRPWGMDMVLAVAFQVTLPRYSLLVLDLGMTRGGVVVGRLREHSLPRLILRQPESPLDPLEPQEPICHPCLFTRVRRSIAGIAD